MLTFIQTRSQQSYFYPQHSNIHKTCLHCPLYFFTISGIHQHFFPLYIHMYDVTYTSVCVLSLSFYYIPRHSIKLVCTNTHSMEFLSKCCSFQYKNIKEFHRYHKNVGKGSSKHQSEGEKQGCLRLHWSVVICLQRTIVTDF